MAYRLVLFALSLLLIGCTAVASSPTVTATPRPTVSLWATDTAGPTATARPTAAPKAAATVKPVAPVGQTQSADSAPCAAGQVKGNRNSKIYHVPGGGSYSQTRVNVECFDTGAQAAAAGYRAARN